MIDPDGKDARILITQDKNGNYIITIQSTIFITGVGASEKKANSLTEYASKTLKPQVVTHDDGKTATINFDITYSYAEDIEKKDLKAGDNILSGEKSSAGDSEVPSIMSGKLGDRYVLCGKYGLITNRFKKSVTLHESMHLLGLSDRYTDNPIEVKDQYGKTSIERNSISHPGFVKDIMGAKAGCIDHFQPELTDHLSPAVTYW